MNVPDQPEIQPMYRIKFFLSSGAVIELLKEKVEDAHHAMTSALNPDRNIPLMISGYAKQAGTQPLVVARFICLPVSHTVEAIEITEEAQLVFAAVKVNLQEVIHGNKKAIAEALNS